MAAEHNYCESLCPRGEGISRRDFIKLAMRGGGTIQLLLVVYPEAGQATAALDALRASAVSDLVAADVDDRTLGAVFGTVDAEIANGLLKDALR